MMAWRTVVVKRMNYLATRRTSDEVVVVRRRWIIDGRKKSDDDDDERSSCVLCEECNESFPPREKKVIMGARHSSFCCAMGTKKT